jgi:hypothetical protein
MRRCVLLVCGVLGACAAEEEAADVPDGADAEAVVEVVGRGSISTALNQTFPAIDPLTGDLWYSEYEDSFDEQTIMFTRVASEAWSSPEVAPFSGQWGDRAPRFSPDGSILYFTSNRPLPGSQQGADMNIWAVRRDEQGWSDPRPAEELNSPAADMHASVSDRAVWFASGREGGFGRSDLYRRGADGLVTHLGPELNDELSQPDLWISRDESVMILAITDHPDGLGGDDLYVVRRVDGRWAAPVNLGPPVNTAEYEYGPSVDAEGRYLYFTSHRDGPSHIYRVSLSAIGVAAPQLFTSGVAGPMEPWTSTAFDAHPSKFTFAVFSDLNGGERSGVFEVAVEQLSLLRPELIMSVGDLIDGATQDPEDLSAEWDDFDRRANEARAPVFRVGGNHDLTGRVLRDVWAERFGPHYYHFIYRNVLFLVLDTEDHSPARMQEILEARSAAIDAAARGVEGAQEMEYYRMPERLFGNIGPDQSRYFVRVLAEHPDVRWTLLFMHKPVWTDGQDPDFVAIEAALSERPFTVFNGHFHTLAHTVRNGRDYIMLGTTGGGQSDDPMSLDHVTLVTMGEDEPSIAHLRLDGILDKTGSIPAGGAELCFRLSECEGR